MTAPRDAMRPLRVVVGVDFSAPSIAAAGWTAHRFAPDGELVLVHAADIPEPPEFLRARYAGHETVKENAVSGARARLEALAKTLGEQRVRVDVRLGRPRDVMAAAAGEHRADVISVGRHGEHEALGHVGSTADALVRAANVPVLLAAAARDLTPRHIIAAVDDAPVASSVMQWAQALSRRFDAHVTAVYVMSPAALSHVLSLEAARTGQTRFTPDEIREHVRDERQRWLSGLAAAGVAPEKAASEIAFGDPASELLAAVDSLGADLIVLGTQGAGRVPRLLLGSTVSRVLGDARCPVLIVPRIAD